MGNTPSSSSDSTEDETLYTELLNIDDNAMNNIRYDGMSDINTLPIYEALDNFIYINTTITSVKLNKSQDYLIIECNPSDIFTNLVLKKTNDNFIELFTKLKNNKTYKFKCSYNNFPFGEIVDIMDREILTFTAKIITFTATNDPLLSSYKECLMNNELTKRFLIGDKASKHVVLNKNYSIKYSKAWRENFYVIIELQLCE